MADRILKVGDRVTALISVQGLVRGQQYTITGVETKTYGIVPRKFRLYEIDHTMRVMSAHIICRKVED